MPKLRAPTTTAKVIAVIAASRVEDTAVDTVAVAVAMTIVAVGW